MPQHRSESVLLDGIGGDEDDCTTLDGWTRPGDADAYERLLCETVLPGLQRIDGYRGGYVVRRADGDEVQFVVVNLFTSLEAVKAFAGSDYETAVFEPEARKLLARAEPRALHYDVRIANT